MKLTGNRYIIKRLKGFSIDFVFLLIDKIKDILGL